MTVDELISRSVVRIHANDTFGTGFFVAESTVLTCAHVVAGQDEVRVVWDGADLMGTVTDRLPAEPGDGRFHGYPDIAVIKLRDRVEHPCAWLAEPSPRLQDGTGVTAHGFSRTTTSMPGIGRDSRYLTIGGLSEGDLLRVMQDSVPAGMSGGPVIDPRSGRVAGLVKASVDRRGVRPVGGWIVTVATVHTHLPELVIANRLACGESPDTVDPGLQYLTELAAKDEPPGLAVESERTPFQYLDPRRRIVDFLHRPELDKLVEWCRANTTRRVRLVCGPGGAGKTRLSVELVDRVRRVPGWSALRVRRADVDLERLAAALRGRKVLLCLEDGEEWEYDLPVLLAVGEQENLRILLLARTYGDWWGRVTAMADTVHRDTMRLAPLGDELERGVILRQAYQDFRPEIAPDAPVDTPAVLVNAAPDAANALELLAAALAVLLHCREHDGQPPEGEIRLRDSLADLLVHERKWWQSWARGTTGLDDPAAARDFGSRVLLLPALYLAADHEQGSRAVAQAFADRGFAGDLPGRVADTLNKVWPPRRRTGIEQYWDALRPDPLGETLVLEVLREAVDVVTAADLVSRLFEAGADRAQAEHALTVLTRAERAASDEDVRGRVLVCVRTLLENHIDVFLPAGVFVAAGLSEPSVLIDLMRSASGLASEQTLRDAAAAVRDNDMLASLEAHLWRQRAEKLRDRRNLTVSERRTVAEQYRWETEAHLRAEESAEAFGAVAHSIEFYGSVSGAVGGREFAEDHASVFELAEEVATRVGAREDALRYIRRATALRRELNEDSAIQRNLHIEADLLEETGRSQEASAMRNEAQKHARAYKMQMERWFREILVPPGNERGGSFSKYSLPAENQGPPDYEGPRPAFDDPMLRLVIPVGHFAGPMYTEPGAEGPSSFEVRFRDGVYSLNAEEYAVWAVSHGDPSLINEHVPTTREVVEYAAGAAGVDVPGPLFDSLISNGLLVEVGGSGAGAREFARQHQVIPLALGLGNSAYNPAEFQIGLPNMPRISVGYDVYHMWLFSYRTPTLWDAVKTIAEEAKEANGENEDGGVRLVDDPDLLLAALLRALQILVSTSCVFIDRCD
jgi:Trypsin-like peptidase domain